MTYSQVFDQILYFFSEKSISEILFYFVLKFSTFLKNNTISVKLAQVPKGSLTGS
jgi:hypothetical protein